MPLILSQVPLGRMSEPDEVAAMAVHLASAEGRGMTGSSTVISNGAYMG
jgi:NAD(P)-dependent dehydrogenase (short-subunit alcohol dehydrogenase family)